MISLVRVDNRLIHGQVVEAWLPYLKVRRVVVADDEAAESGLIRSAMKLAVPENVEVSIQALDAVPYGGISDDDVKTMLLIRKVESVQVAQQLGLKLHALNLGNVHFETGRRQISPSVFLSSKELDILRTMAASGISIDVRAVPSDKPINFDDLTQRYNREV